MWNIFMETLSFKGLRSFLEYFIHFWFIDSDAEVVAHLIKSKAL